MNQKHIGIVIILIGLILVTAVTLLKAQEDKHISSYVEDKGTCYLDDGTCLHDDRDMTLYIIGWIISGILIIISAYLIFSSDKNANMIKEHQRIAQTIEETKKQDEFKAFLSGFEEDNQKIIKAIKENEGITQATLRYKTGLSKSHLSDLLKKLEQKEILMRKSKGKTYQLFLTIKY